MRKILSIIFPLFAILTFTSCEDEIEFEKEYEASYKVWKNFQAEVDDSYRYTVTSGSWTGFVGTTTLTIEKGEVVKREYILENIEYGKDTQIIESWTETKAELNSHKAGDTTITLEEVYKLAKEDWLQHRKGTESFFETNNNGMISACGYVENGCQDDCFIGIMISKIIALT